MLIGGTSGTIAAGWIASALGDWRSSPSTERLQRGIVLAVAILNLLLACLGVLAFLARGRFGALIGALIFAAAGLYLLRNATRISRIF